MIKKIKNYLELRKIFCTYSDIAAFRSLRKGITTTSAPVAIRVKGANGHRLLVRPKTSDHHVLWDTFFHCFHLPKDRLQRKATILDLGANVGYTAAHFASLYPDSKIFAYELDSANFAMAKQNLSCFPQCHLTHSAVWSTDGQVSYNTSEEAYAFRVSEDHGLESVCAKSMETIINENNLKDIGFVKMDIEGAEANILEADKFWLKDVKAIKIELHEEYNPNANYDNCAQILTAVGFHCQKDSRHGNCLEAAKK